MSTATALLFASIGLISALPAAYGLLVTGMLHNARFSVPDALEPKVYDLWRQADSLCQKLYGRWIGLAAALVVTYVVLNGAVNLAAYAFTPLLAIAAVTLCRSGFVLLKDVYGVEQAYRQATGGRDLDEDARAIRLPAAKLRHPAAPRT